MFADEENPIEKNVSNEEFDVATFEIQDPSMKINMPRIPPANEVVLVPDTQVNHSMDSSRRESSQNQETESTGDDFLFHGQGATAIGYQA